MSSSRTRRRGAFALVAALPVTLGAIAVAAPAEATVKRPDHLALTHSQPAWATSHAFVRTISDRAPVSGRVYLAPRDRAGLAAAVKAVSTPGSASYHHFISPGTYLQTYGPSNAAIASVRAYLRSQGLTADISADHRYLAFRGVSSQARSAFGTRLGLYRRGGVLRQASTTIHLPSSLYGAVLGVSGLSYVPGHVTPKTSSAPPPAVFHNGRPCSRYYGQVPATVQADGQTPLPKFGGKTLPFAVCGYIPSQLRAAYGVTDSTLTGTGATIAVVDAYAAPTILSDANTYAANHGDSAFADGQFRQSPQASFTHQADCDPSGWYGEETLDVEAAHGMATDANVLYYPAKSCFDEDFGDEIAKVLTDNRADVITNSYGEGEADVDGTATQEYDTLFQQAAMQGVTVDFSSGDNGDEVADLGDKQADSPASDPYVTAVGGTSLAVDLDDPSDKVNPYLFEAGWGTHRDSLSADGKSWTGDTYLYGAGGGYSTLFNRPSYQQGVVPADDPVGRAVPDVAMDADPTTGMLVGETQLFPDNKQKYDEYRIGGTSLASPLMAGVEADVISRTGKRLGFINPSLYKNVGTPLFHDITNAKSGTGNVRVDYVNGVDPTGGLKYTVRTFGQDSSLDEAKGWDPVTGVGTPTSSFLTSFLK